MWYLRAQRATAQLTMARSRVAATLDGLRLTQVQERRLHNQAQADGVVAAHGHRASAGWPRA